jgi:hypothetical protein
MAVLATQPPKGWRQLVCSKLDDPSERVRLLALEIISQSQWREVIPRVQGLASSPRPAIRRRAAEVLDRFGRRAEPNEYGDSVIRAANHLANSLGQAGMKLREVIPHEFDRDDDPRIIELLDRCCEEYLDRPTASNSDRPDAQGVLLLAAASRLGRRKMTLRLWEQEIGLTDSDDDLLNRGLEALARNRMVAGLAAYRRGDKTEALQELSSVAKFADAAGPSSPIQVYVRQSGDLSAAIWQSSIHPIESQPAIGSPISIDRVAQLAGRLLDRLDLADSTHRIEAHRRIDAWCGLAPNAEPTNGHRTPMAN